MLKSSSKKGAKKRVSVKEIPAAKKKITGKEMKKVKGGTDPTGEGTSSFVIRSWPKKSSG